MLLAGCVWAAAVPGPYTPEVAGVVTAADVASNGQTRYVLANGGTFTVDRQDSSSYDRVYEAGPEVGDLLLAGQTSGRPWLALVQPGSLTAGDLPLGCYELISRGVDRGDTVQTDVGLVLKKAQTFNTSFYPTVPGNWPPTASPGMRYDGTPQVFCLDDEGLVTAAR